MTEWLAHGYKNEVSCVGTVEAFLLVCGMRYSHVMPATNIIICSFLCSFEYNKEVSEEYGVDSSSSRTKPKSLSDLSFWIVVCTLS